MTFIPKDKVEEYLESQAIPEPVKETTTPTSTLRSLLEKLTKSSTKRYSDGLETISPPAEEIPEEGIYANLNLNPEKFKEFLFFESSNYFDAKRKDDERPARFRHEMRPMVVLYHSYVYYFVKDLGIRKARELLATARKDNIKKFAEDYLEICLKTKEIVTEDEYRRYHEEHILKDLKIPHTFRGRPILHESAFLRTEQGGLN